MENENKMINEEAAAGEQAAEKAADVVAEAAEDVKAEAAEAADTVKAEATEAVKETAEEVKSEAEPAVAAAGTEAAAAVAAAPKKSAFAPVMIVLVLILTAISAASLYFAWTSNSKADKLMTVMSDQWGINMEKLANGEIEFGKHPEYDDTAVVEAYKSGDSSKLSDKDKYVLETVSAAIDEIITEDMSDYDKELAVFDWIYKHVHYNDSNFVDVETTGSDDETTGETGDKPVTGGQKAEKKAEGEARVEKAGAEGQNIDEKTAAAAEERQEEIQEEAENDPIAQQDPYKENYDYEPYGVLKYKSAICVGYSTTFKVFMDILDIPCQLIHSTEEGEHCWNLVQIDGDWYHADLTLDNGDLAPAYNRFNVTDTIKLEDSYPWDPTDFPAADSLKYCYMVKNSIKVDNIYDVPQIIHDQMEEGKTIAYLTADDMSQLPEPALDEIANMLSGVFPYGNFWVSRLDLDDEHSVFTFLCDKGLRWAENGGDDGEIGYDYVDYDSDKLYSRANTAFADYYGQYAVG